MTILSTAAPRDYTWLQAAVARWLHRSDLTEQVADFIALAEARIYRSLRIRAMETPFSGVTADGVLAVPSDYVELKHARTTGSCGVTLERRSVEWIREKYGEHAGDPRYIARDGDSFRFGPAASDGVTVEGTYYARLADLSVDNPDNWLTANAPDLLLFAALCEAAPYMLNDARIPVWEGKFGAALQQVQSEDDAEAYSGSSLSIG